MEQMFNIDGRWVPRSQLKQKTKKKSFDGEIKSSKKEDVKE